MWFNSKQRAEPYQPLTWGLWSPEMASFSSAGSHTGAAWLSSARVVRCWVKSRNERNPHLQLPSVRLGTLKKPPEPSQKSHLSSDCTLQLECMKLESLVIAQQHGAVNTFPGLVHTARHTMGVGFTRR